MHISLILTKVPFIQEVSALYTSLSRNTDLLKVALRARKVSGAFEKRAPGKPVWLFLKDTWRYLRLNVGR